MGTVDFSPTRRRKSRLRALRERLPLRVVLGALAIAAIVLAFVFRPGQPATEPAITAQAKPTLAAAAVVPVAPTAAPLSTPAPASKERNHTVASGDTLSGLASRYYGDASKYLKILDANKDVLKNADSLQVGMKLRIPE